MPGPCLYCYNETGAYEVGYHITCAKKFYGQYPPPLIPFEAEQIEMINKSTPYFTAERKRKGEVQSRLLPAVGGKYLIKPEQRKPYYLPETEALCLKLAEEAGIEVANNSLAENNSEELLLLLMPDRQAMPIAHHANVKEKNYAEGSYEQLVKAIEKSSAQPGLDKVYMAERLVFAFLTGCPGQHWGTVVMVDKGEGQHVLAPMQMAIPIALLQPALADEFALSLAGKRANLNEKLFDRFFEKIELSPAVAKKLKRKFSVILRPWFDIIENSFLPDRMKRSFTHIIISRAERLGMM